VPDASRRAERHVVNAELGQHGAVCKVEIAHDEITLRARCFVVLGGDPRRDQHRRDDRCQ
jgi:hypothetical protein